MEPNTVVAFGRCQGCTAWHYVRPDGTMRAHDHVLEPRTCPGTGKKPYERGWVHGNESTSHRTKEEAESCQRCR